MKKKIAVILMLCLLLITGCGKKIEKVELNDGTRTGSKVEGDGVLGTTNFADMVYEHYDPSAIETLVATIREEMADASNANQALEDFKLLDAECEKMAASYQLAELHTYLDSTDEYYQQEFLYIVDIYTDLADLVNTLGHDLLESPCGDLARENWREADIEDYEKYVPLTDEQKANKNKEAELVNRYKQAAVGDFSYNINGTDYVLEELADAFYAGEINYDEYLEAYNGCMNRMGETLGPIYLDLVKLRQQIAATYGYDNYSEYAYEKTYDRDYTVADAEAFCKEVKEVLAPAYSEFSAGSRVDPLLNSTAAAMPQMDKMAKVQEHLAKVDPVLAENFQFMLDHNLYDIEEGENKANVGFTMFINQYNEPFFYTCPDGNFYDVMTIVHEFGHFNSYCVNVAGKGYYQNLDLAEIHSQGLELLYTAFYGDIMGEDLKDDAEIYTMQQRAASVLEGCLFDEFQREVYELEDPTLSEINVIFSNVASQYYPNYYIAGREDWTWIRVSHNFESPLYYISYAVSVIPALQIWELSKTDFEAACDLYMNIVYEGEVSGYKETLKAVGLATPFDEGTMTNIAEMVRGLVY